MTDRENGRMRRLRSRVRTWTLFFIVGLVLSGLTALPIRFPPGGG